MIEKAKREAEEERQGLIEERRQREQARIDRLLAEASALQQAETIRAYVVAARGVNARLDRPVPEPQLEAWAARTLAQADRISTVQRRILALGPVCPTCPGKNSALRQESKAVQQIYGDTPPNTWPNTPKNTPKYTPNTAVLAGNMRSDSATWERLYVLLAEDECDQTVYGYRVDSRGHAIKPYLFCWYMHQDLLENIRDRYGPGEYRLLIRKGRTMVFSGYIGLAAPIHNRLL